MMPAVYVFGGELDQAQQKRVASNRVLYRIESWQIVLSFGRNVNITRVSQNAVTP
jgi:hypothetical protein